MYMTLGDGGSEVDFIAFQTCQKIRTSDFLRVKDAAKQPLGSQFRVKKNSQGFWDAVIWLHITMHSDIQCAHRRQFLRLLQCLHFVSLFQHGICYNIHLWNIAVPHSRYYCNIYWIYMHGKGYEYSSTAVQKTGSNSDYKQKTNRLQRQLRLLKCAMSISTSCNVPNSSAILFSHN